MVLDLKHRRACPCACANCAGGWQAVDEGAHVQDHVRQGRGAAHLCAREQSGQGRAARALSLTWRSREE